MVTGWRLAQLNIARARAPLDDPLLADFVARLDAVNVLAERSPGFVWRLQSDAGNATDIRAFDDPRIIVNMSVWESLESLFDFTYRTAHAGVMARRREWFERLEGAHLVLWWIPAGTLPSLAEAKERLAHLDRHGPTARAFTFRQRFPEPQTQPQTAA
jgi:hypothetical protein